MLLIPHYLADTEYPAAAITALESVSAATGLIFPTDRLREEGRDFVARIDDQVEANQELARLVGTLEERHDTYMQENPLRSPLTDTDGELPTADEIAAELRTVLGEPPAGRRVLTGPGMHTGRRGWTSRHQSRAISLAHVERCSEACNT